MEEFSDYSSKVIEFTPFNQGKTLFQFVNTSIATDPLPNPVDKSVGTNKLVDAETQTQLSTSSTTSVDDKKLGQWLKRIFPLVEAELLKGPTPISYDRINLNDDEDELSIQAYQKLSVPSKEPFQGLATWLSIYANNTPVLVITTSAVHDDWCEHVDANIKVFIPKRMPSSNYVVFQELKCIPTKACLETLSTNPFDKDVFAGSTVSGDLYIWKFISNREEDVQEMFCENLQHGSVVSFDWASPDRVLTCHANGWVCLWQIGKLFVKEGDFLVKNTHRGSVELTAVTSLSLNDFVVGCADGTLLHCNNSNMGVHKTEIEISPMQNHEFAVTSLFKSESLGKRVVVSCDLSGEVFFHDLMKFEENGMKAVLRIPLPFQTNIACSDDGKMIFCPGIDGSLKIYRLKSGKQSTVKGVLQGKGNMIKLSDNGLWIVTGIYEGDFQIFSVMK